MTPLDVKAAPAVIGAGDTRRTVIINNGPEITGIVVAVGKHLLAQNPVFDYLRESIPGPLFPFEHLNLLVCQRC